MVRYELKHLSRFLRYTVHIRHAGTRKKKILVGWTIWDCSYYFFLLIVKNIAFHFFVTPTLIELLGVRKQTNEEKLEAFFSLCFPVLQPRENGACHGRRHGATNQSLVRFPLMVRSITWSRMTMGRKITVCVRHITVFCQKRIIGFWSRQPHITHLSIIRNRGTLLYLVTSKETSCGRLRSITLAVLAHGNICTIVWIFWWDRLEFLI